MSQRRLWTVAGVLVAIMFVPRPASAYFDWIWQMSGPQMIGITGECRVGLQGRLEDCEIAGAETAGPFSLDPPKRWLALSGGLYFSTGKNAENTDFEAGDEFMLAFDPMFEFITAEGGAGDGKVSLYHGIGATVNFLTGPDFDAFFNGGFKFRPVGLMIGDRFNVSYTLRVYPRGFTAEDFGKAPSSPDNDWEAVHGFTFGVRF